MDVADSASLGAHFDQQLQRWSRAASVDPNPLINRIGSGLGEQLVRRAGLRWVVASDAQGTEIAVHGQPGDILLYPTNIVAKRWVANEYGFLPALVTAVLERLGQIRDTSE